MRTLLLQWDENTGSSWKRRGSTTPGNSRKEDPISESFPERVYEVVLKIPEGYVTTYGTIAAVLGDRRAARMVGWAMSSCPPEVSEVAHRVVNRYGELSGGWAWGHPDIMKQLLEDEGVTFTDEYRVDLKRHFWLPPSASDVDRSEPSR